MSINVCYSTFKMFIFPWIFVLIKDINPHIQKSLFNAVFNHSISRTSLDYFKVLFYGSFNVPMIVYLLKLITLFYSMLDFYYLRLKSWHYFVFEHFGFFLYELFVSRNFLDLKIYYIQAEKNQDNTYVFFQICPPIIMVLVESILYYVCLILLLLLFHNLIVNKRMYYLYFIIKIIFWGVPT